MPSLQEHIRASYLKTGKKFLEIHEWLDGRGVPYRKRISRHNILNVPKFLPVIRRRFGESAAIEYLRHLNDDYNSNLLLKALKRLMLSYLAKKHNIQTIYDMDLFSLYELRPREEMRISYS